MTCIRMIGLAAIAGMTLSSSVSFAQDAIGGVESLRNQASRSGVPIRMGDRVFQNETITTASDSSVRIAFVDQTNLAIGPASRVVLDRFVYNATQQGMAVNLSQGAFRFTTGNINKAAVRINTPTATMGVRGSVVNVNVNSTNSSFTLLDESEGVWVCPRRRYEQEARRPNESDESFRRRIGCRDLTKPGDTASVDSQGNITQTQQSPTQFGLNGQCAANPTLCGSVARLGGGIPFGAGAFIVGSAAIIGGGAIIIGNNNNNSNNIRPLSP